MILSIGEILADMVGSYEGENLQFRAFCGGAPFNVAVNAKQAGAEVAFVGRVGKDVIGRFLLQEAKKAKLEYLDIQQDCERNTTLAFISLVNGERDFAFNRYQTADYNIDFAKINFSKYLNLKVIHLGSLMLSEEIGRAFAKKVLEKSKELGVKFSFDLNFRTDIYKDFQTAKESYQPYIEGADIIKFSEEEVYLYTGKKDILGAIENIYRRNQLFLITLGEKGSLYYYNGKTKIIETKKVTPIDTTGAGDAFLGCFLGYIENREFNEENIEAAIEKANEQGAKTTQFMGAIKL